LVWDGEFSRVSPLSTANYEMLLDTLNRLSFWGIISYDGLGCRTRKKLPGRVRQGLDGWAA